MRHSDLGFFKRFGIFRPLSGRMNFDRQAGHFVTYAVQYTLRRAQRVTVQRNHHNAVAGDMPVIAHNAPSLHKGCLC